MMPPIKDRLIILEEADSTNTYLKNLPDAAEGQAVLARRQSGGRGRQGRSFSSPEGGLYLSLRYTMDAPPGAVTAGAAVAVRRAIKSLCDLEAGIKWVNDLIIGGKKVCGILTEQEKGAYIIGVGVNIASAPEGVDNAACLADFGGRCSVEELAAAIIRELDVLAAGEMDFREEYISACLNLGREQLIVQGDSRRVAFAEAVDADFSLVVRLPDGGREKVFYGEVSLRAIDGTYI